MIQHTVVITGATKGLGRATALAFAAAGHQVIGLYASDAGAAEALQRELHALGRRSLILKHDVSTDSRSLWALPEIQEAQHLVLINNACAPFTPQPFHLQNWSDVQSSLEVSLKGSWLCSHAVLRPMVRAGGGTIVNVLTAAACGLPPKGFAAYTVAKHALRGLALAMAAEYASRGIRVFSVLPGFMSTPLTAKWDPHLVEAIRARGPVSQLPDAARRIRELVEAPTTRGLGDEYPI